MEEKIIAILADINEDIPSFEGHSLFDAGLLDSLKAVDLVAELEDAFDVDIDAEYVVEENFRTKDTIIDMMKSILEQ